MKHSELVTIITKKVGKEPTQKELADILGLTRNGISSRAFRDAKYDYDEVEKLKKFYNLTNMDTYIHELATGYADKKPIVAGKNEIVADYYPDTFGSCGNGVFTLSEQKEQILIPKKIIGNFSKAKKYSVINAYGDSMSPFIQDKDLLVIEQYDGEQVKDDRIYVFMYEDKIFIKRLVLNINQLFIKSDNPMYSPVVIDLNNNNNIHIIGKVAGIMRKTD